MTKDPESLSSKIRWLEARIERLEECLQKLDGPERAHVQQRLDQLIERRDMLAARLEHIRNFGWAFGTPLDGAEFTYEAMKDSVNRMMSRWL